jgi:hypothetical protein
MVPSRYGHQAWGLLFEMPDQNLRKSPEPNPNKAIAPVPTVPGTLAQSPIPQQKDPQRSSWMHTPTSPSPQPATLRPESEQGRQPLPHWLQQSEKFLRVVVRMYIGLAACITPWMPSFWDANPLFSSSLTLNTFISQGAVKGMVSGLGLLNLWIALRDAVRSSDAS